MRTVVITGATGGLGGALIDAFADKDWQVIGVGRKSGFENTRLSSYFSFDAGDLESARSFWRSFELTGDVCLVNNAGYFVGGRFLDQPESAAIDAINGSYLTAVHMTRGLMEVVPTATILNVVSHSAVRAHAGGSTYGAAKAAMAHFFASLQEENANGPYRITNVYPGPIDSAGSGDVKMIERGELAAFIETLASQTGSLWVKDCVVKPSPLPTRH